MHPPRIRTRTALRPLPWALALAALIGLMGLHAAPLHAAPGAKLRGKWKATAMEVDGKRYPMKRLVVTFEFKAGGVFQVAMSAGGKTRTKQGTWSATARRVRMTVDGKTESMPYTIRGRKLTLTKKQAGRTTKHYMTRVR